MGVLKMGTIGLDGTKIHATRAAQRAFYEYAGKIEAQLKAEVADLMAKPRLRMRPTFPTGCRSR